MKPVTALAGVYNSNTIFLEITIAFLARNHVINCQPGHNLYTSWLPGSSVCQ